MNNSTCHTIVVQQLCCILTLQSCMRIARQIRALLRCHIIQARDSKSVMLIRFCISPLDVHVPFTQRIRHPFRTRTRSLLTLSDLSTGRASYTLSSRPVKMSFRDPAGVESSRIIGNRACGDSRSVSADDRDLVFRRNSFLATLGWSLGSLSALSSTFGLWEKLLKPSLVYIISSTSRSTKKHEVEKETNKKLGCRMY